MIATATQLRLAKILTNRINAEAAEGTLEADKENVIETIDAFVAGNKITLEQSSELNELIQSKTTTK
ncbi:hypothetical protein [Clostridium chromiireducens]|uniref:Uncharacterized protein n=1 Tax=Clostridium chromiireducens TaxID=225345 RepID=A0A1V4IUS7_9CLOT|nr:hypothetical protein [Clostridium chromiireducens]OPJ63669.1 hypothetical protein CLCHR_14840 [Clostridium chromiireducens]